MTDASLVSLSRLTSLEQIHSYEHNEFTTAGIMTLLAGRIACLISPHMHFS